MHNKKGSCNDAGTVHCPCTLASCRECMNCSRLAGKDFCDCDWQGVCIYNEYLQNGALPVSQRSSSLYRIQKKIWYEKDLAVMRIKVPRGFAETASLPGSCVFVRSESENAYFDMPVSVLCTSYEDETIDIAVKAGGPKSYKLLDTDEYIRMRGVYRNGLIGRDKLLMPGYKKVLCLTKGIGLAPAVNYCRWAEGRHSIDMIIDPDKISRFFAEDCTSGCKVNKVRFGKLPINDTLKMTQDYDLIMVCASDYYQENIRVPEEKRILTNNFTMCCGEGICGACICRDDQGNVYRMCKCKEK